MRVILVGTVSGRAAMRNTLADGIEVIAEARDVADARALGLDADALLLLPEEASAAGEDDVPAEALTPRELEVLELVADGLANKSIAAKLAISDQTVKFHVRSICDKLGAANRTEAVRLGLRRGLISV
jgi:NarL family two-component system response regulator YdfI